MWLIASGKKKICNVLMLKLIRKIGKFNNRINDLTFKELDYIKTF
jgi:hypothetical protein